MSEQQNEHTHFWLWLVIILLVLRSCRLTDEVDMLNKLHQTQQVQK